VSNIISCQPIKQAYIACMYHYRNPALYRGNLFAECYLKYLAKAPSPLAVTMTAVTFFYRVLRDTLPSVR
jgi:hypothetical protein